MIESYYSMQDLFANVQVGDEDLNKRIKSYSVACQKNYEESLKQNQVISDTLIFPLDDHFAWIESLEDLISRMGQKVAVLLKMKDDVTKSMDALYDFGNKIPDVEKQVESGINGLDEEWI